MPAQIIKCRGDGFEEDSGSVVGKTKVFLLKRANKRLKNYRIFPFEDETSELNDMFYRKTDDKVFTRSEIRDSIYGKDDYGRMLSNMDGIVKNAVDSIKSFNRKLEQFLICNPSYDNMPQVFDGVYERLEDDRKVDFWYTRMIFYSRQIHHSIMAELWKNMSQRYI